MVFTQLSQGVLTRTSLKLHIFSFGLAHLAFSLFSRIVGDVLMWLRGALPGQIRTLLAE